MREPSAGAGGDPVRSLRRAAAAVTSDRSRQRLRALRARAAGHDLVQLVSHGEPGRVCGRVRDWAAAGSGPEPRSLLPATEITRELPRTLADEVPDDYVSHRSVTMHERYLVPIADACIVSRTGLVVLPDGSFSAESVYGRSVLERQPEYSSTARRPRVVRGGDYFSLLDLWYHESGSNHYHWLHDTLLRLHGVREHLPRDTRFLVPPNLGPVQQETLRALGIDEAHQTVYPGHEVWQLETLHFAPPVAHCGWDRPEPDGWLRGELWRHCGITPTAPSRRILVSRRHAPSRRVTNEDALADALSAYGFETCVAESLSLCEQVALFAEAEVIVGAHGAGLTNMLLSPSGTTIVETVEASMMEKAFVYWWMAGALGHEYWYVPGGSVPRPGAANDLEIPLELFVTTVAAALGEGPGRPRAAGATA